MKKSKKIVSLLLSVLMIITALPLTAVNSFAEDTNTKTSGDYEYTVSEDGTAEITAYNRNEENVVIPSVLDGYAVTVIGEKAFALNKTVKTVEIPNGVIGIRSSAFWLCENLTEVKFPETVKWISSAVFDSCKKLKSVNLPEGLQGISNELFNHCESLENITLPKSIKYIDNGSFYGCKSLKSIVIPYGVTRICEKAFEHCEALESVIIPESVIWIETWAFNHCYSLESVTVPESVTSLSPDCFDTTNTDFAITIYGIKGSAAESYAKNYEDKCNFIAVDSTHYYGEWIVQDESTCDDLGKKYRECGCGHTEFSSIEKKPHTYNDGVVTTLPTFDEEGVKTYTCTVCTETKTEPIAKLKPFPDVASGEWYCNAIAFNVAKGYFHGYANGYFGPGNNIQRQDFVVVLSKIAGADLSAYAGQNGGFSDVPTDDYYSAAVAWAKDNHILSGYADGKFGVGDPITREQACVIFFNYITGYCDMGVGSSSAPEEICSRYPDGNAVSDWARTAVAWAAENHIVGGNGRLNPAGNANRAEMAQIIMNMSNNNIL